MLSNAYFLAKFRFDTAENKPAKNLQNFANTQHGQAVHDAIMTELRKGKDDSLQKFLDGVNGDDSKFHSDFTLLADAVRVRSEVNNSE